MNACGSGCQLAQSQHLRAISPVLGLARGASRIEPQREQETKLIRIAPIIALSTLVIGLNMAADGLAKALGVDRAHGGAA